MKWKRWSMNRYEDAQTQGDGYQLLVLNAQSYDGLIYNIPGIIDYLLSSGVEIRQFLIDEAWGSANYFQEGSKDYAAMNISDLREKFPELVVISTQSAHKSLSCLCQASMIHFRGPKNWRERLNMARFCIHTTSPSYPILASLDLARAQMQIGGAILIREAVRFADSFRNAVATDPTLSNYRINMFDTSSQPFPYAMRDATKVSLNISATGMSPEELRDRLLVFHGVYVNRLTSDSMLLNFHIGINASAMQDLLQGLREVQRCNEVQFRELSASENDE